MNVYTGMLVTSLDAYKPGYKYRAPYGPTPSGRHARVDGAPKFDLSCLGDEGREVVVCLEVIWRRDNARCGKTFDADEDPRFVSLTVFRARRGTRRRP